MKMLSTVLPVREYVSREIFINTILEWIKENTICSARDNFELVDIGKNFEIIDKDWQINSLNVKRGSQKITGIRFVSKDYFSEWQLDMIFSESQDSKKIKIELTRIPIALSDYPSERHYGIIKYLASKSFFEQDIGLEINGKVFVTGEYNIELIADVINGNYQALLPIVYVSTINGSSGHEVNVDMLAKELCGVAHIFAEESNVFSLQLRDRTSARNPHGGYVGIYYPKLNYFKKFGLREDDSSANFESYIQKTVRKLTMSQAYTVISWPEVVAEYRKNQEMDEFAGTFDSINQEIQTENVRLKSKNAELFQQCAELEAQCSALKDALRSGDNYQKIDLVPADIKEFFEYEQYDLVVNILEAALINMNTEHRDYELLSMIVKNNAIKGYGLKIIDSLKEVFNTSEQLGKRELSILERLGFEIKSESPHYKIQFKENPKYSFTFANSPSDPRYGKNMISDVIKKISVYKKR